MGLTCNIDSRGKRARLIYGLVFVALGVVLLFLWALSAGTIWSWVVVAVCLIAGGFAIFEARAGWCAMRAMGFKTRM